MGARLPLFRVHLPERRRSPLTCHWPPTVSVQMGQSPCEVPALYKDD
jgi:hypothetical protein